MFNWNKCKVCNLNPKDREEIEAMLILGSSLYAIVDRYPGISRQNLYNHKKHWELTINWRESINASLPQWYVERFGQPM